MQFLLDHLSSLLVGAVLMIGLPVMALRASESSRDATQADTARAHLLGFTEVMGQDFSNVGSGVDLSLSTIVDWAPGTAGGPTVTFEFRGAVQPIDAAPVEQIRYDVTAAGTEIVQTKTGATQRIPLYQIERSVWDGARYVPSGASAPRVTAFDLHLARDGVRLAPTDDLESADEIEVTVVALVASGGRGPARYARWRTSHALLNLTGALAAPTP